MIKQPDYLAGYEAYEQFGYKVTNPNQPGSQEYDLWRQGYMDALEARESRLRALLWFAWNEINAINARDGAPQHIDWGPNGPMQTDGCAKEWWGELTEALSAELGEDAKPWPIIKWATLNPPASTDKEQADG